MKMPTRARQSIRCADGVGDGDGALVGALDGGLTKGPRCQDVGQRQPIRRTLGREQRQIEARTRKC